MKFAAKEQQHHYKSLAKKLVPYALYAILPIALLRFYLYPSPPLSLQSPLPGVEQFGFSSPPIPIVRSTSSYSLSSSAPRKAKGAGEGIKPKDLRKEEESESESESWCDYTEGKWVPSKLGPLYNGSCGTIKDGQNCISHGRPDVDYLYWRWEPRQCKLPRFDPEAFFNLMRDKHLAFVGDSMARNQLESLLCMLASFSTPKIVYSSSSSTTTTNGVGDDNNKFRRWHFPSSFNVTVSIYWSPFLVRGTEKSDSEAYNKLYLDSVDERWASDLDGIDMLVLSIGHWYLHPAVYFEGRREDHVVLGCHFCEGLNHTEVGFYDAFRKAYRTALNAVTDHQTKLGAAGSSSKPIHVIVTTFSPHHFEGEWDKAGACPKTKPYDEGEGEDKVQLQGMDEEMRKIGVEQVEEANKKNSRHHQQSSIRSRVKMEALDITKLALLRPDGHPGPYMHPNPFANGFQDRVQNDCVHWCMPGPIDTWNEIMLELIKKRWRHAL